MCVLSSSNTHFVHDIPHLYWGESRLLRVKDIVLGSLCVVSIIMVDIIYTMERTTKKYEEKKSDSLPRLLYFVPTRFVIIMLYTFSESCRPFIEIYLFT